MTVIKSGFRLTVRSWENDADNYCTQILEGLSEQVVQYYVALCRGLECKNQGSRSSGVGNMYHPDAKELKKLKRFALKMFNEHKSAIEELFLQDEDDHLSTSDAYDIFIECHTEICGSSEFTTRVVETYKIEFVPQDIVLEDVTDRF